MNGSRNAGPSPWFYALGGVCVAAGVAIFLYALLHGIFHVTDSLTQVVVPGEAQLNLKRDLDYTVFVERESVVNGKIYATDDSLIGLECNAALVSGVQKISMRPARGSLTYNVGGRSGRSVFEFRVPEDGAYDFACGYSGMARGPQVVVAVGSGVGEAIMKTILQSLGGMFGGFGLGGAIFFAVFILRARAKKSQGPYGSP